MTRRMYGDRVAALPIRSPSNGSNVQIVRHIHRSWDTHGTPAASGLLAPEIEWVNPGDAVEPGTRRGIAEFEHAIAVARSAFPAIRTENLSFVEAGFKRVVVIGTLRWQLRGAAVEQESAIGYLWTLRDGKAVRFQWFRDPGEALEAARK